MSGINHAKTSGKGAPADPTKVGGDDWDADHVITDGAIALAKLVLAAANSFTGNPTGSSAARIDMTATQATALLNAFSSSLKGLAPASGGGTTNFLRADGSWASPSGSGVPTSRTLTATAPLTIAGTTSADLSADRTLAVGTFGTSASGVVPASGGGTANFLRADGTWAAATGSGAVTAAAGHFGSGIDGAAVFDGSSAVTNFTRSGSVYTATKPDYFFTTATFSAGVTVDMSQATGTGGPYGAGRFWANVGIVVTSGTATIKIDGNPAVTVTGGAALITGVTGAASGGGAGSSQGAGQTGGAAGSWPTGLQAGKGGFGGASSTTAGSTVSPTASLYPESIGGMGTWQQAQRGKVDINNAGICHGGSGGGSGGGITFGASGGAGGGGAGVLIVAARTLTGSGSLVCQAVGGAGAAAGGTNAGGGSGGGGGYVFYADGGSSQPGALTLSAAGGAGGAGNGGGSAGGNGTAGSTLFFALGAS